MTPYAAITDDPLPLPAVPGLAKADWYAFATAPARERAAGEALQGRGLTVFVPIERALRKVTRYAKEVETIERALFPGYLFVRADRAIAWLELLAIEDRSGRRLLRGVVGYGGQPAAIRHDVMRLVIEMSGQPVEHKISRPRPIHAGGKVRIVGGALRWVGEALKVEALDAKAATVFLSLFGSARAVDIPLEHLEAVT